MPLAAMAAPDGFLVAVGGGGVQVPVPGGQGVGDGLLGLVGGDLEHPEPEDRHLHAVVEGDGGNVNSHEWSFISLAVWPWPISGGTLGCPRLLP